MTVACLVEGTATSKPPPLNGETSSQRGEQSRRLSVSGAGVDPNGVKAASAEVGSDVDAAPADARGYRPLEVEAEVAEKRSRGQQRRVLLSSSFTTLGGVGRIAPDIRTAGTGRDGPLTTGDSEGKNDQGSGGNKEGSELLVCRERSSGPLRGGELT